MAVIQKNSENISLESIELIGSPYEALSTGRLLIRGWADSLEDEIRLDHGRSFVYLLIKTYWARFYPNRNFPIPKIEPKLKILKLNSTLTTLAETLGNTASKLGLIEASYLIGAIYTVTIPETLRSENGVYFTPPALTNRLLNLVEIEGIKWENATILDPACGGGAFLAPVALRVVSSLQKRDPEDILCHVESYLKGYEIDFFSAWLSQVFLEVALSKYALMANRRLKRIIEVCDTLKRDHDEKFDVIIGNPPYGKIKLEESLRSKYKESLYGHANLYGLFTQIAIQQIKRGGVIAYVTPTSFLAGEYFKNLRQLLATKTSPRVFDFVTFRKGVFDDVLQETMLATYKASEYNDKEVAINEIHSEPEKPLEVTPIGKFKLPENTSDIWILPRNQEQSKLVYAMERMTCKIKDWGYEVKTGPLVWNRHKLQLSDFSGNNAYPLIWAEAITSEGKFIWKADKKNHTLFFNFKKGDEWLLTNYQCILLQRTTAKEQQRRLIAAILPKSVVNKYKAVVIENHINLIKPIKENPTVSLKLLHSFLNSIAADTAFRCISGSVAVSAYELETMPVPNPKALKNIQKLIDLGVKKEVIEEAFLKLYKLK
jgi:adenine-specific DNA-methyltransferase